MRVPESNVNVGIGGGGVAPATFQPQGGGVVGEQGRGMQALGQGLGKVADAAFQFEAKRQEARQRRDYAHGKVEMARIFEGLDQQYRNDEGFADAEQRWGRDVGTAKGEFLKSIEDEELREALGDEFEMNSIRYRSALQKGLFERERDWTLARFDSDTEHYVNQFVLSGDEAGAAQARADFEEALDGVGMFAGAAERQKRLDAFDDTARFSRAMHIAEKGDWQGVKLEDYKDLAPVQMEKLREALDKRGQDEGVLGGIASVQGLEYEDQLKAVQGIEDKDVRAHVLAEVERQHRISEGIRVETQAKAFEEAWNRALDTVDGKAKQPLSVPEVRAMGLEPTQKEHLVSMLSGKAKGEQDYAYPEFFAEEEAMAGKLGETDGEILTNLHKKVLAGEIRPTASVRIVENWRNWQENPINSQAVTDALAGAAVKGEEEARLRGMMRQEIMAEQEAAAAGGKRRRLTYEQALAAAKRVAKTRLDDWLRTDPLYSFDDEGRAKRLEAKGVVEPERPADLPKDAAWDKARAGWVIEIEGKPYFKPYLYGGVK